MSAGRFTTRLVGDSALRIVTESSDESHRLAAALAAAALAAAGAGGAVGLGGLVGTSAGGQPALEDLVPTSRSVLVIADPLRCDLVALASAIAALDLPPSAPDDGESALEVPTVYDGDDIEEVARLAAMSIDEVARRHSAPTYRVAFCGFSPGFGYLEGGDPALEVPRRATPRGLVDAGAVALAGAMTAIYPQATPGGWQLIGRSALNLFDPLRQPPALLWPGRRVRFRRVTELPDRAPKESSQDPLAATAPLASGRWVDVLRGGPLTTVQNGGRLGLAHLGVPRAGPLDAESMAAANAAVGNAATSPALECTLSGPELRFSSPALVAIAGADTPLEVDGTEVPSRVLVVQGGQTIRVGAARSGLRSYLAVDGGFSVPAVLGSRSTDTLSGLGPPPLVGGQRLELGGPATDAVRAQQAAAGSASHLALVPTGGRLGGAVVRVIAGPHDDVFPEGSAALLTSQAWTLSPSSDRTGARLHGTPLPRVPQEALPSEGVITGAVQVPPDGQPIVLLANHATTGGYPVLAVVATADLPVIAQARPGTAIRFELVSRQEALAARLRRP